MGHEVGFVTPMFSIKWDQLNINGKVNIPTAINKTTTRISFRCAVHCTYISINIIQRREKKHLTVKIINAKYAGNEKPN